MITILALIAALLGDPAAPATKFLDQRGGTLIAIEVGGIIITGLLAMFVDRRRTLKQSDDRQHEATVLESNEPEFPED